MNEEKVLLVLAANPFIDKGIQFDEEIKEIEKIFNKRRISCYLKVVHTMAVTWRDLQNSLVQYKPFIWHFIGHGNESGVILDSRDYEYEMGYNEDLSHLVGLFSKEIKCIFLNSCNSYVTAQILSQEVEYVIGIEGEINDISAIEFSLAFYDAISFGSEIERAFQIAMVTFERYGAINKTEISNSFPHLYKKDAVSEKVYDENRISPCRLPWFSSYFEGRMNDFKVITDVWNDGRINVLAIEAWGGVGKTSLVGQWRTWFVSDEIYSEGINVFDWSFHRQGVSDNRPYTSEEFMDFALKWFQVSYAMDSSPSEKGNLLAKAVQHTKTLFILDGLESVQALGDNAEGMILDEAVRTFICSLLEYNPGLCIITTRKHIVELDRYEGVRSKTYLLQNLGYEDSTALLKKMGVYGTDTDFRHIYENYKGHPLTLSLLGAYVRDNLFGKLDTSEFKVYEEDRVAGNRAYGIMKYYDNLYQEGCQLGLLRVLSLFDRSVEYPELCVFFDKPGIANLTEGLPNIFSLEWGTLLRQLKNSQLVMEYRVGRRILLDLHPMIREYYYEQLKRRFPESFITGNKYLSDYYISMAEECQNGQEKMHYYFRAVLHGCKAGKYIEMYQKIYLPFIKHYEIAHDARMYGGYGTNLDTISGFFRKKWDELYCDENESIKADLFAEASFALICLGEIRKARYPLEKAIDIEYRLKDYKKVATYYGNLSEIYLLSGEIKRAFGISICGIGMAELCNEIGRHNWAQMTKCANVLNQMGKKEAAQELFKEAELLQRKYDKSAPNLYGILAYKLYDVTLSYMEDILINKRLKLSSKMDVEINDSLLEEDIEGAIVHDQNSGNYLYLGADYISSVRLKLIRHMHFGTGSFEEIEGAMERAMQYINRGGRKEFVIYALITYAKLYGIFNKKKEAEKYLKEAKDIATHYNFELICADIDIEAVILKIQCGEYKDARFIYNDLRKYKFIDLYGKRLKAIDMLSNILENKVSEAKKI